MQTAVRTSGYVPVALHGESLRRPACSEQSLQVDIRRLERANGDGHDPPVSRHFQCRAGYSRQFGETAEWNREHPLRNRNIARIVQDGGLLAPLA